MNSNVLSVPTIRMVRYIAACAAFGLVWIAVGPPIAFIHDQALAAQSGNHDDVDAFMEKVLEKRELNWRVLNQYVFNEIETLDFQGMQLAALQSFRREYTWFVRDGYLVRSPIRVNGVPLSEKQRGKAEKKWKPGEKRKDEAYLPAGNFFGFKFEPGNYFFAGRRFFDGHQGVIIEYYPQEWFDNEYDDNGDDEDEMEDRIAEQFKKTTLVRMIVNPEEFQIMQITFENVGLEFLPYRWLVRVDDIEAQLTMNKPVEDIWLPREIGVSGRLSTAARSFKVTYLRRFFDYKKADVSVDFQFRDDE